MYRQSPLWLWLHSENNDLGMVTWVEFTMAHNCLHKATVVLFERTNIVDKRYVSFDSELIKKFVAADLDVLMMFKRIL